MEHRTPPLAVPLFSYGTLLFDEVVGALLGRTPAREQASLDGYRRVALIGKAYPAVTVDPAGRVDGTLLTDLTPSEQVVLDRFEGPSYRIARLRTREGRPCYAYVQRRPDGDQPWVPEEFAAEHLQHYVRRCRALAPTLRDEADRQP